MQLPSYTIRLFLLAFAVIIALASLYYTQQLVEQLGVRERKLIDLYAKGLRAAAQTQEAGNLSFLFQEIIEANNSVPVILTTEDFTPISYRNLDIKIPTDNAAFQKKLLEELETMRNTYPPIEIEFSPGMKNYIFYKNSALISRLKYYPYVQLTVIFLFVLLGYLAIRNSLKAEQNRVWVGMAKETAHQLGTPISSLMAWVELFKNDTDFTQKEAISEMEKDITRLETITARFSNIGSAPVLKSECLYAVIQNFVAYMQARISAKATITFQSTINSAKADINKALFEWAIENIIKNAVDAMAGVGNIHIQLNEHPGGHWYIDITDSGKGMTSKVKKSIFKPGFTTKQRGWGLGLTLTKRIIENYHAGKVFVKYSKPGKGTTFRILLPIST